MFDPKPKGKTRTPQAPFPQSFEWSLLHSSYWIFVCISCLFGRAFHQVFSLCRSSLRYDRNSGLFLNQPNARSFLRKTNTMHDYYENSPNLQINIKTP